MRSFGSRSVVAPPGQSPAEAEGGKKSTEHQTPKAATEILILIHFRLQLSPGDVSNLATSIGGVTFRDGSFGSTNMREAGCRPV